MCDSSIPESIPFWSQNIIRNNFQNNILDFNQFASWNKKQLNSFFFAERKVLEQLTTSDHKPVLIEIQV